LELRESGPVLSDLDVEVFDRESWHGFAEREAGAVADLFLRGAVKSAVSRLRNLVPLARPTMDPVNRIESLMASPRLWKRQFQARHDQVATFLGDEVAALNEGRLHWNFGKLYDGSIEDGKLDSYEDRITESLGIVLGRLERIRDEVGTALATATDALAESAGTVADTFAQFADDLFSDLRTLHEASSKTIETVDDPRSRGRLCDALAEGLHEREIAGRFVVVVANRMVEAS
jgi:hypothetical protein